MDKSESDPAFCPRVSPLDQRYQRVIPRPFEERTGMVRIYDGAGVLIATFDPFSVARKPVVQRGGTQAAIPPKREPLPHPGKQTKTGWR